MKELFPEEPSDEERDAQMRHLRDLSKLAERQHGDSIARWLELADKILKPEEDV